MMAEKVRSFAAGANGPYEASTVAESTRPNIHPYSSLDIGGIDKGLKFTLEEDRHLIEVETGLLQFRPCGKHFKGQHVRPP